MPRLSSVKNGVGRWFGRKKDPGNAPATVAQTATISAPPGTSTPQLQNAEGGNLNLVNFSPEQLMNHVDQAVSRVQFGWTKTTKFMERYSEVWALVGPLILLAGTIGEVFLVLWLRQKDQSIVAGMSIVAVALVLEGTFLAVSYKAATIRNRGERHPGGPTDIDKRKLRRQFAFWCTLAIGVCATQVVFIAAQTKDSGIGTYGVWTFAILRAVFTLVADGYTAFAHEEMPTTGERALEEQQQRATLTKQFLEQKKSEVTIINDGILQLRQAHTEAEIKEDKLRTHLEVEKLQNRAQVETLQNQQKQATMFTRLGNSMIQALFDPELPDDQREKLLGTMQGLMSGMKQLPPAHRTRIEEEDM